MAGPSLVGIGADNPLERAGARVLARQGARPDQRRTFTLLDRVTSAIDSFRHPRGADPVADTDITTLDSGTPVAGRSFAYQEYFKTDNTRLQVYEDVKEMDETTDEVSAALDTLADSSVNPEDGAQHTFVVEIDDGPYREQAQAIFDQVTDSCDLHVNAFSIARDMLKFGDCFLELVVDETYRLARLKFLPQTSMWRNEDQSGNLMEGAPRYAADSHGDQQCVNLPGECAFDQRESLNGRILAAFAPWQIVHVRWNRRGSERYGRSLLRTARLVWKKLRASEEALVIARLQRAWMRFAHYVDTTGMTAAEARNALRLYRQDLSRRFVVDTQLRDSPFEVTSDFYISSGYIRDLGGDKYLERKSKIDVLQGDHAVLAAITDIEYLQNKLFASLRVPKAYLGFERDINAKSTLTSQDIQFARILRRIQQVLSQTYKEIFDFALVLAGIDPAQVGYTVRWPAILVSDEERDAIIRRYHAQADAVYWQMGGPSLKWIIQHRYGMDDEAWALDLIDALNDPPTRLKIPNMQMPATMTVVGAPGAATLADAAKAALKDGAITDVDPDAFDEKKAAIDNAKRQPIQPRQPVQPAQGKDTAGPNGAQPPNLGSAREEAFSEAEAWQLGDDFPGMADSSWRSGWRRGAHLTEDDWGAISQVLGYDPRAQGLGMGMGGANGTPATMRYQFVPGRGRGEMGTDADRFRAQQRVGSVMGVHSVSTLRGSGRGLPITSAHVQGAAAQELTGFLVDLSKRKERGLALARERAEERE